MIVPEILLSTSLISLVIFIWTFINQWSSTSKVCERPSTQQKSEGNTYTYTFHVDVDMKI